MNITQRKRATDFGPLSSYIELLSYSNHPKDNSCNQTKEYAVHWKTQKEINKHYHEDVTRVG